MNSVSEIFGSEDLRIERCDGSRRGILRVLQACREERRPYLIAVAEEEKREIATVLVPVSRLEEEVYKAEVCTYIARKTGAELILMQAKDYGSRAAQNVAKIVTRIERLNENLGQPIRYRVMTAKKDSDHVMREAAERAQELQADLLILTASRDYGMDDLLFGPQEQKAIQRSAAPCLLVNPRGDLFSLCD